MVFFLVFFLHKNKNKNKISCEGHRRGREVDGPKSIHMRDGSLRFPVDLLSQLGHQSDKTRAGWCDGGQGVQVIDCIVIFGRPMRWCYKPSGATCWIDHASITAAAVTTRLATHNTNRFTVLRERSFRAWVAGYVLGAQVCTYPSRCCIYLSTYGVQ